MFKDALSLSKAEVCYNGDIFTVDNYNNLVKEFPKVKKVMLGRGILANPGLIGEIKDGAFIDKKSIKGIS